MRVESTLLERVLVWLETDRVIRWGRGVGTVLTVVGVGGSGEFEGRRGGESVVGVEPAVTDGGEIGSGRDEVGWGKEETMRGGGGQKPPE